MNVKDFLLKGDGISFNESPNHGTKFSQNLPDTIIIHFTAGSSFDSSVSWLTNPSSRASAHLVIGREGEIAQLVPFDTIAWHAGRSSFDGRSGFNKYSIGIEIDNAGILTRSGDEFKAWFGGQYSADQAVQGIHRNETVQRYWHAYTEKQITLVEEICSLLIEAYDIKFILGHEEISPLRKTDPGPAFPLDKIRDRLLGEGRNVEEPEILPEKARVNIDKLNIRSGPGIENEKVAKPLKEGTEVSIIASEGNWYKVKTEIEGWVHKNYLSGN